MSDRPPPMGSSKRNDRKRVATKREKEIFAEIGATPIAASGAKPNQKGDARIGDWFVELKTTEGQYMVRRDDLAKLCKQASEVSRSPVMILEITSPITQPNFPERWAVIPFKNFYSLFDLESLANGNGKQNSGDDL